MIKQILLKLARVLYLMHQYNASFRILCYLKTKPEKTKNLDYYRALIRIKSGHNGEARQMLLEELRHFPDNKRAQKWLSLVKKNWVIKWETDDPDKKRVFEKIESFTMLSEKRLIALYDNTKDVLLKDLKGSLVECGVAAGGSSALLAHIIDKYSIQPRKVFCFDSFCGMPSSTSHDVHHGLSAKRSGWGEGTCSAPVDSLLGIASELGVEKHLVPVPGYFHDTLPKYRRKNEKIAVLHLDGDWYESTRVILANLFDLVIPGGYIQIDDYGFWEGCRKAVDEFESANHLKFKKQIIDETGICFFKE